MRERKILLVGGTVNQIKMMHRIADRFENAACFFTPFYYVNQPLFALLERLGLLRYSLGKKIRDQVLDYLTRHDLPVDFRAQHGPYDLVVLGTDIFIPGNLKAYPKILVQEGIVLPRGWRYWLARHTPLPNWVGAGHAAGLSGDYDYFCVASQGTYEWLAETGIARSRMVVTGLPNFDNIRAESERIDFPHRDYVLLATSCSREDWRYEDRRGLLEQVREIAGERQIIVKLHPREDTTRATEEVRQVLPKALVYSEGEIAPMIAHCAHFVATSSTTIFNALACDKPITCEMDLDLMRRLTPEQNGNAAANIVAVCEKVLADAPLKRGKPYESEKQPGRHSRSRRLEGYPG
jgi:hypothetical protein